MEIEASKRIFAGGGVLMLLMQNSHPAFKIVEARIEPQGVGRIREF